MMEMIRNGSDNAVLSDRLHRWSQSLLMTQHPAAIEFLLGMIDPQERDKVTQLVWRDGPPGGQGTTP